MLLLISDANILIDFIVGQEVEALFKLPDIMKQAKSRLPWGLVEAQLKRWGSTVSVVQN